MGRRRRAQGQTDESAPAPQGAPENERGSAAGTDLERGGERGAASSAKLSERTPAPDVRCEACGKTVPRLQAARCASCKRILCRLCVRWYGHFMLVCEDCRAAEW